MAWLFDQCFPVFSGNIDSGVLLPAGPELKTLQLFVLHSSLFTHKQSHINMLVVLTCLAIYRTIYVNCSFSMQIRKTQDCCFDYQCLYLKHNCRSQVVLLWVVSSKKKKFHPGTKLLCPTCPTFSSPSTQQAISKTQAFFLSIDFPRDSDDCSALARNKPS